MKIEINNKQTLKIYDVGKGVNVDVLNSKGKQTEPTLLITEGEIVALLNLAREVYTNGISVDEYLVYGKAYEDIEETAERLKALRNY